MNLKEMFDNNCLLAYQISTDPDPIQASPEQGNPSYTALTIVVSNNTEIPIYCNQIKFFISVGSLAQNLTENTEGILVAASPSNKWQITNNKDGSFTATPTKPEHNLITIDGVVFQIYKIQVNKQVGEFTFSVEETSSNDNSSFSKKDNDYQLAKFPYGFYMKNFAPSSPLVPNGSTVTLDWIASDLGTYTIFYADKYVDVTGTRSYTSLPLNNTTTFILKGTAQYLGESVSNYLSTTVVIANPQITATSLNVLEESNLKGDTTIGTDLKQTSLHVKGNQVVDNSLTVTEKISTMHAIMSGCLNVSQGIVAKKVGTNSLIVENDAKISNAIMASATVSNLLSVSGTVSLMQSPQAITPNKIFFAPTDGFLVGFVGCPNSSGKKSMAIIWGKTNTYQCVASGGNCVYWTDGSRMTMWSMPNSFVLPVRKGDSCENHVEYANVNEENPPVNFYWIPLGSSAPVTVLDLRDISTMTMPEPMSSSLKVSTQAVESMVKVIDTLFGGSITEKQKNEVRKELEKLLHSNSYNKKED